MSKSTRQMRSAARLYAVQALFQMEASDQAANNVVQEFEDHRFGAEYDGEIASVAGHRSIGRLDEGLPRPTRAVVTRDPNRCSGSSSSKSTPSGIGSTS